MPSSENSERNTPKTNLKRILSESLEQTRIREAVIATAIDKPFFFDKHLDVIDQIKIQIPTLPISL